MTYEISARTDEDYKVVGLPLEENKKFWLKEDELSYQYNRLYKCFVVFASVTLNSQFFLLIYEGIDVYTYIIFAIIHIIHGFYYFFVIFHMIYTLNVFFITILIYIRKKFNHISKQLEHLQKDEKVKINNKKLSRLIYDFNYVYLELMHLNSYFKYLSGTNLINYSLVSVFATFVFLFNDNIGIQISGYTLLMVLYILALFFPSQYSSFVNTQVRSNITIFKITF